MSRLNFFGIMSAQVAVLASLLLIGGCGGGGSDGGTNPPPSVTAPSNLSYESPQQFVIGQPIAELSPTITGNANNYFVSPALPGGLALDPSTGHITGTPQQVTPRETHTITASNSGGSTTFGLVIEVIDVESFWVEPKQNSTIGVDQIIQLYAALKKSSDPYPRYLEPGSLTFQSSDANVASVDSEGRVLGIHEGSATVAISDGRHSSQVTIAVSGRMIRHTVAVSGQGTRTYWIYAPQFSSAGSHPAIISMHGGGGSAMIQASMTQLNALAARQQLYVVYLEGSGAIQTFNAGTCCGAAQSLNVDDVLYVSRVIDDVDTNYVIDTAKTFATGFSNGAMMSHRLACALANRISGIAAISGGSAEFDNDGNQYFVCSPQRPIPILHIHALNDRNYPYAGGTGAGISGSNFYSIDATIHDWRARNNVTDAARIEQVTSTTTCYHYETAADTSKPSAPVVLCKLDPADVFDSTHNIVFGGGHSWPGGVRSPANGSDVPTADFDANSYLWKFFGG